MVLDVNVDIYKISVNDKLTLAIASTLNIDGSADEGFYDASIANGRATHMDRFEYVMYGKIFKHAEEKGATPKMYPFLHLISLKTIFS